MHHPAWQVLVIMSIRLCTPLGDRAKLLTQWTHKTYIQVTDGSVGSRRLFSALMGQRPCRTCFYRFIHVSP
eukprot:5992235-Amphidinium_carterae.3